MGSQGLPIAAGKPQELVEHVVSETHLDRQASSDCAFQHPGDIDRVSESVHKLTHFLTKSNTGHNVFMTRGRNFDKPENEEIEVLR